ncbi:hypothetical protein [Rhizobium mongolense]
MNETEAADLLVRQRVLQQVDMMRKGVTYVCGNTLEVRHWAI